MKTYLITSKEQCLIYAPQITADELGSDHNIVYVCALGAYQEHYRLLATMRIDLDACQSANVIGRNIAEFICDTQPHEVVMCWALAPGMTAVVDRQLEISSQHHRQILIDTVTKSYAILAKSPHPHFVKFAVLVTDATVWSTASVVSDKEVRFDLARRVDKIRMPPKTDSNEEEPSPNITVAGIWRRVSITRRMTSIETENALRSEPESINGIRLWSNSIDKVTHCEQSLTPSTLLFLLGNKERIGKLNAALYDSQIRDRILLWAISDIDLRADVPWADCYQLIRSTAMSQALIDRARLAIDILNACASFSADDSPCAYATIAYLYWWIGEVHLARQAVELALDSNENYRLAQLMDAILTGRIMPPWFTAGRQKSD